MAGNQGDGGMSATRTAMEQAAQLQLLAELVAKGKLWTPEQRKDARILVALLSDHALASERRTAP